jgi:glycosyltransferase involved in cell wall biosynthesis
LNQIARYHDVWAVTHGVNRASIEEWQQGEQGQGINFCYVSMPRWLTAFMRFQGSHQFYYHLWQVKAYFAARRLNRQNKFDLFHHITYANDWLASFIGALIPLPYVRGPGGGAHKTPAGFLKEYNLKGLIWEKIRSTGQWLFRHDPFFIIGQRRAKALLVCNNDSMAAIPNKWSGKAHILPLAGVSSADMDLMAPENDGDDISNDRFTVLTAGVFISIKGFGMAIRAFKKLSEKHPNAQFKIVGSGPDEANLRQTVADLDLQDRVHFLGWLPRNNLLREMKACDVFLFPSLRDGGGMVVIEALAAGTPVVCIDTAGPGMHVTDDCGIKVAPSSPDQAVNDMGAALNQLYSDETLRLALGAAAREKAEKMYHWDRLGEFMMEIYSSAVDGDSAN